MSKQKQSRADLQGKKIEALIGVVKQLLEENNFLKDLAVGTLEIVKNMQGYNEALEIIKQKASEKNENNESKLEL